jgi:hypothetical protein
VLLEQPHRLRIDGFAADAHGRWRAEEIEKTLTPAAAAAGFDQRGRFVPAAIAGDPQMRQSYFLFGFFLAPEGFAFAFAWGRAFGFAVAAGFFAAGRSALTGAAGFGGT